MSWLTQEEAWERAVIPPWKLRLLRLAFPRRQVVKLRGPHVSDPVARSGSAAPKREWAPPRRSKFVPSPTASCPRPGDCFYCRWYTRCPHHAGEPMDWQGYFHATVIRV